MHKCGGVLRQIFFSCESRSKLSSIVRFASTAKKLELPEPRHLKLSLRGTDDRVALIEFHRPKALNALNGATLRELDESLQLFDGHDQIGAIVITGSEKAFAAGADIKELSQFGLYSLANRREPMMKHFPCVDMTGKPVIAAVNGIAFGGGCELAMSCDIIYAGEKASFGLPEVKLGAIPGAGGTQRVIRAVGKSKGMEMCLTGNPITAHVRSFLRLLFKKKE